MEILPTSLQNRISVYRLLGFRAISSFGGEPVQKKRSGMTFLCTGCPAAAVRSFAGAQDDMGEVLAFQELISIFVSGGPKERNNVLELRRKFPSPV